MNKKWTVLFLAATVSATAATRTPTTAADVNASLDALEYAFRFASAIHADTHDMHKAQQSVVLQYAALGALDQARERADRIEGWRRAEAYASLAGDLARQGRAEEARELIERARAVQSEVDGWQNPRISARIAEALAVLGEVDRSGSIAERLARADPRQYGGRSVSALAVAHAARGEFEQALEVLQGIAEERDFVVTWWRTLGHLDVAATPGLTSEQRASALDLARRSADGIAGWKRAEALVRIADRMIDAGRGDPARETLGEADRIAMALDPSVMGKPLILAGSAECWARLGEGAHARELLRLAEDGVGRAMVIEIPGLYAGVAAGYQALEDPAAARRLFDRALTTASELENSRPRALALVTICNAMGRSRSTLDEWTRQRLETLYGGLGDPW
jgi:tetratricopeptide (TPR) repeat protein